MLSPLRHENMSSSRLESQNPRTLLFQIILSSANSKLAESMFSREIMLLFQKSFNSLQKLVWRLLGLAFPVQEVTNYPPYIVWKTNPVEEASYKNQGVQSFRKLEPQLWNPGELVLRPASWVLWRQAPFSEQVYFSYISVNYLVRFIQQ